jgi:hypothetical protein
LCQVGFTKGGLHSSIGSMPTSNESTKPAEIREAFCEIGKEVDRMPKNS